MVNLDLMPRYINCVNCLGNRTVTTAAISSEASKEERSTTIPKGSRVQVNNGIRSAQPRYAGEDIVSSNGTTVSSLIGGSGLTIQSEELDYLGGFGIVHASTTVPGNARVVKWDSAA